MDVKETNGWLSYIEAHLVAARGKSTVAISEGNITPERDKWRLYLVFCYTET